MHVRPFDLHRECCNANEWSACNTTTEALLSDYWKTCKHLIRSKRLIPDFNGIPFRCRAAGRQRVCGTFKVSRMAHISIVAEETVGKLGEWPNHDR